MLSLLAAARERFERADWPAGWPDPPDRLELHGIELRPRVVRRAREVLRGVATIEEYNLKDARLPACDAVLVFDVLHLMPADAQDRLLAAIAGALRPDGVIVLREANPDGGWRFQMVRLGNRLVALLHGRLRRPFHFRREHEWQTALRALGLAVRPGDTTNRTPFANVTLYGSNPRPTESQSLLLLLDNPLGRSFGPRVRVVHADRSDEVHRLVAADVIHGLERVPARVLIFGRAPASKRADCGTGPEQRDRVDDDGTTRLARRRAAMSAAKTSRSADRRGQGLGSMRAARRAKHPEGLERSSYDFSMESVLLSRTPSRDHIATRPMQRTVPQGSRPTDSVLVRRTRVLAQVSQEPMARLSEMEARAFAQQAASIAKARPSRFAREFQKLVRTRIPKYQGSPRSLMIRTDLLIVQLMGQITAFQSNVIEQIRTFKAIDDAAWPRGAAVTIFVNDEEAPSIQRAVIMRDGKANEAIENQLTTGRPHPQWGALRQRSGWLIFDQSVFVSPTGRVDLVLIPEAGSNITTRILPRDLTRTVRD